MIYGVESFTGIRPTSDLTIANYIGAIQPILEAEERGEASCVFLAELHAATTHSPSDVMANSHELGRTLIASGVSGDIYSQKAIGDLVMQTEFAIRGLTTVSRLLRLPTLKEKVTQSDNTANASVNLAMYPMMMAADIILARPRIVPTGKDQKPHLEITNELIRAANREFGTELPEPKARNETPVNILSLDASKRKMSKSYPNSAIFLSDTPTQGAKKIRKAVTASAPGPEMDLVVDNLQTIVAGLSNNPNIIAESLHVAELVKDGQPTMGVFKQMVGDVVAQFLADISERRASVSDSAVISRVDEGSLKMRDIGANTFDHISSAYWRS